MSIPRGLSFDNRIAPYRDGHLFVCQRKGHTWTQIYIPGFKSDAADFRAAHDTAYHNVLFRHVGFEPQRNIQIEQLCTEYKQHVEQLEVQGSLHPATTRHYFYCADRMIIPAFAAAGVRTVRELEPSKISEAAKWMRKHSNSRGGSIIKALTALRTMIRWKGLPVDWQIPRREIKPELAEKRDLDLKTVRRFLRAMPPGSLEEAITLLKSRTGARDVEVYEAMKEEFDLDVRMKIAGKRQRFGVFAPMLHSKRRQKPHVYVLTPSVVATIRPYVERASTGGRVFTFEDGRPVHPDSMRKRYIRASFNAKPPIMPPIQSLAPIRSETITVVADARGLRRASEDVAGHARVSTTLRWYYKARMTPQKLAQRLQVARTMERAIPLKRPE